MRYLHFIFCAVVTVIALTFTSCHKERLNIIGSTSIPELEGRMLYLRIFQNSELQVLDSAAITHGKFQFTAPAKDSIIMAFLFLGDESLLPMVVNRTEPLTITLTENERRVEGSALNDTLYAFIKRKNVIDQQMAELPRRESQMILDGVDHDEILRQLSQEATLLSARENEMVMRFIKDNMDNILAPGVFMIVTSNLPYPILNPQIEELVTLGSPTFLNDAYVAEYLEMARENMEKINE